MSTRGTARIGSLGISCVYTSWIKERLAAREGRQPN